MDDKERGPIAEVVHVTKCVVELGMMALEHLLYRADDAMMDAWDDPDEYDSY